MPGLKGNMPGLKGNMPGLQGNMPGLQGNMPGFKGNMPGFFVPMFKWIVAPSVETNTADAFKKTFILIGNSWYICFFNAVLGRFVDHIVKKY